MAPRISFGLQTDSDAPTPVRFCSRSYPRRHYYNTVSNDTYASVGSLYRPSPNQRTAWVRRFNISLYRSVLINSWHPNKRLLAGLLLALRFPLCFLGGLCHVQNA